jgi:O-antigen/teichoic acid export membrane protein
VRVGKYLKQLAGESAIYGVSSTINVLLGVILMPLLTHVFTVTEYGVYTLVEGAFVLLTMLVVLGLDNASARWFYESDDLADRRRTIGSWFWCQLAASAGLAALLIGFAPAISALVTDSRDYALVVGLMGAVLPFQAAHRVFQNWLRYQRRAWAAVAFASSTAVATVILVILIVVVRRQGLAGFYAARLAAWAVAAMVAVFCLRSWISWKTFSPERLKTMLVFGLPFVPVAVGMWAMRYTDRYILKELCGSEEVGLFGAAFQIAMGVGVVVTAFTQAWGPFAFSLLQHRDSRRVYARVLDAYAFLGCGLCTAVALAAPLLVQILARRPAYAAAASCVPLLAFGALFNGASAIVAIGSQVVKYSIPAAVAVAIGFATSIGLNFLLIPFFARDGAAAASMAAWFVSMAYLYVASQRLYPIPFHWGRSLACLACSFVIIEIDRSVVPAEGPVAWLLRAALLLSFIPLGVALGLFRWKRSAKQHQAAPLEPPEQPAVGAAVQAVGDLPAALGGVCARPERLPRSS